MEHDKIPKQKQNTKKTTWWCAHSCPSTLWYYNLFPCKFLLIKLGALPSPDVYPVYYDIYFTHPHKNLWISSCEQCTAVGFEKNAAKCCGLFACTRATRISTISIFRSPTIYNASCRPHTDHRWNVSALVRASSQQVRSKLMLFFSTNNRLICFMPEI